MDVIEAFPGWFAQALLAGHRRKLGLTAGATPDARLDEADAQLADDWLGLMQSHRVDFTLGWRCLADEVEPATLAAAHGPAPPVGAGGADRLPGLFPASATADWQAWRGRWQARLARDAADAADAAARPAAMRQASPWIIPRNHCVEEALADASDDGDLQPFEQLLEALRHPFEEEPARARYAEPAPAEVTACYLTFCGT